MCPQSTVGGRLSLGGVWAVCTVGLQRTQISDIPVCTRGKEYMYPCVHVLQASIAVRMCFQFFAIGPVVVTHPVVRYTKMAKMTIVTLSQ